MAGMGAEGTVGSCLREGSGRGEGKVLPWRAVGTVLNCWCLGSIGTHSHRVWFLSDRVCTRVWTW